MSFDRRGFHCDSEATRKHLESIACTFVHGFNAGLLNDTLAHAPVLEEVPLTRRGFAYEGLAMQLALFDQLIPGRRNRWRQAVDGIGQPHAYMMAVGYGLARARIGLPIRLPLKRMSSVSSALAADGYGFHHGFFTRPDSAAHRHVPHRVGASARRSFDQGFGRALWFAQGADPERIAAHVASPRSEMSDERREGIWSGVGLAAAYAGGVERVVLENLLQVCGRFAPSLCQGAAFAAECRTRAGNPAEHTDLACEVLCGSSAARATADAREAKLGLDFDAPGVYEEWRARLRVHYAARELVS